MNAARFVARLTRQSRSNFFYAFVLLPRPQREAIFAVYAFCRIVDDAVDLEPDRAEQRKTLARWREEIAQVYGGRPQHPAGERLQQAIATFPIPRAVLEEIIAGVEMDIDRTRYETFDELYPYCYRVASAVGLACIEIFGYTDPRARDYALNLGVALQLTNIIRDVRADAERGRIYLPLDEIRRFGYSEEELLHGRHTPAFQSLMRFQADRAHAYYRAARAARAPADRRRLAAAEIMGSIYHALLKEIEARNFQVFEGRIRLSTPRKIALALGVYLRGQLAP